MKVTQTPTVLNVQLYFKSHGIEERLRILLKLIVLTTPLIEIQPFNTFSSYRR